MPRATAARANFCTECMLQLPHSTKRIASFNGQFKTISEHLFDGKTPGADHYMRITAEVFETPVFKALGAYAKKSDVSGSVISRMLDIPLVDARELKKALV